MSDSIISLVPLDSVFISVANMIDINKHWEDLKHSFPIGFKFYGEVTSVKPFGVFVNLGYQVVDGYKLSGLIDIATQPDDDSSSLPKDTYFWPKVGQKIYCKVVAYREHNREIGLRLVQ